MKYTILICVFLSIAFSIIAQDTISHHKLKINEISIIGTLPINLYNYPSPHDIIFNVLKDDDILHSLIQSGYSDTSKATKLLKPRHPIIKGIGVGVRAMIDLPNTNNSKLKYMIPISLFYENYIYEDYYLGKMESKRLDTFLVSDEVIFLDSMSGKAALFRYETQNIFLQSGINIESGNKYLRFETGLNIGIGIGFNNKLSYHHQDNSNIQATNLDNSYYQSTYSYSEDKIQKVKPTLNLRLSVPLCIKLNLKKRTHFGLMAELSPAFDINQLIGGNLMSRWLLFCSIGARYRF